MKIILGGGGNETSAFESHKLFCEQLHGTKKTLYIPIALLSEKYTAESCLKWFTKAVEPFSISSIDILISSDKISQEQLNSYDGVYIGGGNTFKLLKEFKDSGFYKLLSEYIKGDGVVYGGSAGAIIFGKDISTAKFADSNEVGLKDIEGFNLFNDYSIWCHYSTNDLNNVNELLQQNHKIIALEEDSAIFLNGDSLLEVGKGVHLFKANTKQQAIPNQLTNLP